MNAAERDFAEFDVDFGMGDIRESRVAARKKLLDICPCRWDVGGDLNSKIYVLVQLGDSTESPDDTWEFLFSVIDEAWLSLKPPVPAINRWNKIYYPVAWWYVGICGFYNIIASAFVYVKQNQDRTLDANVDVDVMGLLGSQFFKVLRAVRWKRSARWIDGELRSKSLPLTALLMLPLLKFMGSTFKGARAGVWASVRAYLHTDTSPAAAAMRALEEQLHDDNTWKPLVVDIAAWTQGELQTTQLGTISLMANLYLRCVLPFLEEWPWHLDHCYNLAIYTPAQQTRAVNHLLASNSCCFSPSDGYTDVVLEECETRAKLLSPAEKELWEDSMDLCIACNVQVEDMFARHRMQSHQCFGSAFSPQAQASNHDLSQFRLMYETARERWC